MVKLLNSSLIKYLLLSTVFVLTFETLFFKDAQSRDLHRVNDKGYNVLAFGGSVTWGASIGTSVDREFAYPFLLEGMPGIHHVKNLAIRAARADYPSFCVESLIGDEKVYDIILLEFSLNGNNGMKRLTERLRLRYPNAIFIYVDLYSFKSDVINEKGKTARTIGFNLHRGKSIKWRWWDRKIQAHNNFIAKVQKFMDRVDGYIYEFPRLDPKVAMNYFGPDWHHLSKEGHKLAAEGIMTTLSRIQIPEDYEPVLGKWGKGDECHIWFENGTVDMEYNGAALKEFVDDKFALDLKERGSITVENKMSYPVALYVGYMRKASIYPRMRFLLEETVVTVNPIIEEGSAAHIMDMAYIGFVSPGIHELKWRPLDPLKENFFRMTAIVMCGYCVNEFEPHEEVLKNYLTSESE